MLTNISLSEIQLGKAGLTENFLTTLKSHFKAHRNVKITVLRSACRDKKELKEMEKKILEFLGSKYTAKSIGYTIKVKRWRQDKKEE